MAYYHQSHENNLEVIHVFINNFHLLGGNNTTETCDIFCLSYLQ